MKKWKVLIPSLMAITSLPSTTLVGCVNKSEDDITYNFHFIGSNCTINGSSNYSHDIFEKDKNIQYTIVPKSQFKLPDDIGSEDVSYDKNTGVITISEIKKDITLNVTAIPNPTGKTHTVSYSAEGGNVTSNNPDTVEANTPITPPTLADRPGYDKDNVVWKDKNGDEFDFEEGTNEDIVLFADWGDKIPVTVHFVETSQKIEDKQLGWGERAIYYTPIQEGFSFTGWYDKDPETEETAKEFDFDTLITEETSIYAGWEAIAGPTYNVKFDVEDCSVTYKGSKVGSDGVNIQVPQGISPYYVKFSIRPEESIYKKPSEVTFDKTTDYTFNSGNGDLLVDLKSNLTVSGTCDMYKSLEECSWSQIKEISEKGEAKKAFRVGDEKTVTLLENGTKQNFKHTVRIIGFNHDELSTSTSTDPQYAGITFEFANVITKGTTQPEEVYKTVWDGVEREEKSGNNFDYRNSVINNNLNNDSVEVDSVINRFPADLKDVIKSIKKKVGVSTDEGESYEAKDFEAPNYPKLFLLCYEEVYRIQHDVVVPDEGSVYQYYYHCDNADRIKSKVGGDKTQYWLRSPSNTGSSAWPYFTGSIDTNGQIWISTVVWTVFAVAPAFCI